MAIVKKSVLLSGLCFGDSKSVRAIVLFKHSSPDGYSNFFHFAITVSDAISPTDFMLGTKIQLNKSLSMTQVLMTLTFDQRSRSKIKLIFSQKS